MKVLVATEHPFWRALHKLYLRQLAIYFALQGLLLLYFSVLVPMDAFMTWIVGICSLLLLLSIGLVVQRYVYESTIWRARLFLDMLSVLQVVVVYLMYVLTDLKDTKGWHYLVFPVSHVCCVVFPMHLLI